MMLLRIAFILALLQGTPPPASLLQRAKQDFESGRYSQARAELAEALKAAPEDAVLWSYLGMTDYKLNQVATAVAEFEKARTLDPHNPLNYFNLGLLYHQQGETNKALEAYRQGLAMSPDDKAAGESYARLLIEAHQYRQAISPLEKLKAESPSDFSLHLALIEACLKAGLNDQADREIQESMKAPNRSSDEEIDLAKLLLDNKQPDAARWVLEQVVQAAPNLPDAHAGLGMALADLGRYQDAAKELDRARQLSPGSADYAMRYAEALLLSKQYSAALDFLKSVQDRFGKLPEYRYKYGLACYGLSEYVSAIDELDALVRDYPNLDRAHYYLGHSYSATGDLAKAETQYRKALALNPQDASYYAALGHALRKDSDEKTDEAIGYLQKALQMDPSDTLSRQDLALCYEKKGRYSEAENLLVEVVRQQPGLVEAHRVLARIYYRQGKKDLGDQESGVVSKLDSDDLRRKKEMIDTPPPPQRLR
ncbi:MAG TPA: tetratricopeptide repeat protein [Terriglobia bacterium]|nr:tetratricopeptide repeat protein [Terriglobia bacterium]